MINYLQYRFRKQVQDRIELALYLSPGLVRNPVMDRISFRGQVGMRVWEESNR